jgi:hypothetical protein
LTRKQDKPHYIKKIVINKIDIVDKTQFFASTMQLISRYLEIVILARLFECGKEGNTGNIF